MAQQSADAPEEAIEVVQGDEPTAHSTHISLRRGYDDVDLSKAVTKLLRHCAKWHGVQVQPDGYANANRIVEVEAFRRRSVTEERIKACVHADKKRLAYRYSTQGNLMVKSIQGHSIRGLNDREMHTLMEADTTARYAYHMTFPQYAESIRDNGLIAGGLKNGKRTHIHLVYEDYLQGTKIHGVRQGATVRVQVDLHAAMAAHIEFFYSENHVILTRGNADGCVPAEYVCVET